MGCRWCVHASHTTTAVTNSRRLLLFVQQSPDALPSIILPSLSCVVVHLQQAALNSDDGGDNARSPGERMPIPRRPGWPSSTHRTHHGRGTQFWPSSLEILDLYNTAVLSSSAITLAFFSPSLQSVVPPSLSAFSPWVAPICGHREALPEIPLTTTPAVPAFDF